MKDLFDCARNLNQRKEACGGRLKKLVTELTGSEDVANRLLEAYKSVKPYDCHDFVHVMSEFRKNHRNGGSKLDMRHKLCHDTPPTHTERNREMSAREINPEETTRAMAYRLWMKAPNPMVSFFKTYDVMPLVKAGRERGMKFNMLLDWCIGKAASAVKEFYLLPVGERLMQYDRLAVNTIVANGEGEVSSCDIAFTDDLAQFNADYLTLTRQVRESCRDHDLSSDYMVIGTSAIAHVELDGAVGMNSGIFNNPFLIWGKYRLEGEKALLPISFQFHHTQMDGAHAGQFLKNLEGEMARLSGGS